MELVSVYRAIQFDKGRISAVEYIRGGIGNQHLRSLTYITSHDNASSHRPLPRDPLLPEGFAWQNGLDGGLIVPIEKPKTIQELKQEVHRLERITNGMRYLWLMMAITLLVANILACFTNQFSVGFSMLLPFVLTLWVWRHLENKHAKARRTLLETTASLILSDYHRRRR
jgi:hypothetical protein